MSIQTSSHDSPQLQGAVDQLDGRLHGPAGRLRREDPGRWHRHRLHRGLRQGGGGEGERLVRDVVKHGEAKRRRNGEKMGKRWGNRGKRW